MLTLLVAVHRYDPLIHPRSGGTMSRSVAVLVALSLPLLAACGGDEPANSPPSSELTPSPAMEEGEANTETAAPPSSLTKKFGSTFTWDDGTAVTVSKPQEYTSSSTAYPAAAKGYLLDVTLKNGSTNPISAADLMMQATSGEQQAEQIFDSERDIDSPTASVLPGKSLKYKVAFTKPGSDFTVEVRFGYGNAAGFYEQ